MYKKQSVNKQDKQNRQYVWEEFSASADTCHFMGKETNEISNRWKCTASPGRHDHQTGAPFAYFTVDLVCSVIFPVRQSTLSTQQRSGEATGFLWGNGGEKHDMNPLFAYSTDRDEPMDSGEENTHTVQCMTVFTTTDKNKIHLTYRSLPIQPNTSCLNWGNHVLDISLRDPFESWLHLLHKTPQQLS